MAALNPQAWAEVERLFGLALDLLAEERAAFLERECHDDNLRREVASLLAHAAAAGLTSADEAIAATAAVIECEADPDLRWIGAHFGVYRVDSIVGHGGMGAVYRASRDDAEFHQQVAIKLLRAAAESPSTLQRFKRERQILASLQHPNIARLLDGGSTSDGVPFLVMEFIEGEPITTWCEHHAPQLEQRLRLFMQVCDAVDFAHRSLVVHRDLKPSNILVTVEGAPKLLDFGIAKMLVPDPGGPDATATGTLVMTPEYASPEQVRGDPVSPAVDVYALGLILYELLTGQQAQKMPDSTPGTMARVVCQMEPVAPATVKPQLAGDLDNIIRAAIRKEPQRRYYSVAALVRDLQLHLEGRPVTARPDTLGYRVATFLRRNRGTVAAVWLTATLFGGLAVAYWLVRPGSPPRVLRVTPVTQTGHAEINYGLATDGSYVYFAERVQGTPSLVRVSVEGGTSQPLPVSLRDTRILDISPDRTKLLVMSDSDKDEAPLWEVSTAGGTPRRIGDILGHTGAWSPDGLGIAFGRGSALFRVNKDGTGLRKLLDTPAWPEALRWAPTPGVADLRFTLRSSDGHGATLWAAHADGTLPHRLLPAKDSGSGSRGAEDTGIWASGAKYYLFRTFGEGVSSIWAIKEGRRFLGGSGQSPVRIHSTPSRIRWLAASPDGKRAFFISSQDRRQFVRYEAARGEFVPYMAGHQGRWISYSGDGRWVAYTTPPEESLWRSRPNGSEPMRLTPPSLRAYTPDWSPDGTSIVFGGFEPGQMYGIYAVSSAGGVPERLSTADSADMFPSWSRDGHSVLFRHDPAPGVEGSHGLYVMDWKTRKVSALPGLERWTRGIWSPDGQRIALSDRTQIQILETRTRRRTTLVNAEGLTFSLWSSSGKYVYYQDLLKPGEPIFRARIGDGRIEQMMSSKQIQQSDFSGYAFAGLAPGDVPLAVVIRSNSDVYALDLDLP